MFYGFESVGKAGGKESNGTRCSVQLSCGSNEESTSVCRTVRASDAGSAFGCYCDERIGRCAG